jgi:hypothetical protein
MIFKYDKDFESYKERNFYYKVFAGFLFNELLPEYQANKAAFFNLLINNDDTKMLKVGDIPLIQGLSELSENQIHVTFDFHPVQIIKKYGDRGESSDIMIWGEKYFISIEVKYLSDWTFDKDILAVQQRISDIGKMVKKEGIQVLLIKEKKLVNAKSKLNQAGSNLNELQKALNELKVPILIITWEQIKSLIPNEKVTMYIEMQLKRKLTNRYEKIQ